MESILHPGMPDIKAKLEQDSSFFDKVKEIIFLLPYAEYALIYYMNEQKVWIGNLPTPPDGWQPGDGYVELGLFRHWIKNKSELNLSYFTPIEQAVIDILIDGISLLLDDSLIDQNNYNWILNNPEGLIYTDGSVLSTETFATYDQGWFIAFLNLLLSYGYGLNYPTSDINSNPPSIPLTGKSSNTITIALLGDAGTGDTAQTGYQQVLSNIAALNPDYIVHVGDVYYAGTPAPASPNGDKYFQAGEELSNFLNSWAQTYNGSNKTLASQYTGKCFSLNSNHEMYSGGNGYFYDLLNVGGYSPNTPFTAQQGNSFFSLTFGDWTILCLDTAYYASPLNAYLEGSIGSNNAQTEWLSNISPSLNLSKTIVISHHNGLDNTLNAPCALWTEVRTALGGDPRAWYWGHTHNGFAYHYPIQFNTTIQPIQPINTLARCLGHASLPYGYASAKSTINLSYQSDSSKNTPQNPSNQLFNGFVLLTLTSNGNGSDTLSDAFYDTSTNPQPLYTQTLPATE